MSKPDASLLATAAGLAALIAGVGAGLVGRTERPIEAPATASPGPPPPEFTRAAPDAPMPAAVPSQGVGDLILLGVTGGGAAGRAAIIGGGEGGQRLVRVGRDYRAGLRLVEAGRDYALLSDGTQAVRLEMRTFAQGGTAAPAQSTAPEPRITTAALRSALRPVTRSGRIGSYVVGGGSQPEFLRGAGLAAGDVLLSVNGSQLDAERMEELSWQVANAAGVEVTFMRNGQKMTTKL